MSFLPEQFTLSGGLVIAEEVHPVLSRSELAEIQEFRDKLAYKTRARSSQMFYNWTRRGTLTQRQHELLCRYLYQGYS